MKKTQRITANDLAAITPQFESVARATRRLAGNAYRPHQWSGDYDQAAQSCADFVARLGASVTSSTTSRVTLATVPSDNSTEDCPVLPLRLVKVAIDHARAERVAPSILLDPVYELITGLRLMRGCAASTLFCLSSPHGFGFTFPSLSGSMNAKDIQAAFRSHAYDITGKGTHLPCQANILDRSTAALARQWADEAADPQYTPLDRARRIHAVRGIDPEMLTGSHPIGEGETGELLAAYAAVCTGDDGTEAFARFGSQQNQIAEAGAHPEQGEDSSNERARIESDKQRTREAKGRETRDDVNAQESVEETHRRLQLGRNVKEQPKGRTKAERGASSYASLCDVASLLASPLAPVPSVTLQSMEQAVAAYAVPTLLIRG